MFLNLSQEQKEFFSVRVVAEDNIPMTTLQAFASCKAKHFSVKDVAFIHDSVLQNNENLITSLTQEQKDQMESYAFTLWDRVQILPTLDYRAAFKNLKNLNIESMNSKMTVSEMFEYCLKFKFKENEFFIYELTQHSDKENQIVSELDKLIKFNQVMSYQVEDIQQVDYGKIFLIDVTYFSEPTGESLLKYSQVRQFEQGKIKLTVENFKIHHSEEEQQEQDPLLLPPNILEQFLV